MDYTGVGSSSAAGATSQVTITGLAEQTKYYFTCFSYVNNIGNGTSANLSTTTTLGWNTGDVGNMRKWVTTSNFPTVLADVDGKFKQMAYSSAGVQAIAESAYAMNTLAKNGKACMYMNLSTAVPAYWNTMANTLQNTTYFNATTAISRTCSYYNSSSSAYEKYSWLYSTGCPSGANEGINISLDNSTALTYGCITLITSYKFGYSSRTWPSSGFSGVRIHGYTDSTFTKSIGLNTTRLLVFHHGRYWGSESVKNSYTNAGLSANSDARFVYHADGFGEGSVSYTRNVVSFGPTLLAVKYNDSDKTGTVSGTYYGTMYTCK